MPDWVQNAPLRVQNATLQVDTTQFLNSNRDISLAVSKDGIILINYLHFNYWPVNLLRIGRSLKQLSKVSLWCRSWEYLFGKFSVIINIQTTKARMLKLWWKYTTNESDQSYLDNKEQKALFLVVSRSDDVTCTFDLRARFFSCKKMQPSIYNYSTN